jgi:putative PIN family toxin of toxin-antitoxin system
VLLDTDVVIAAVRSVRGASAEIVRHVLRGELRIDLSVAMALEYEAVATRDEHLKAGGLTVEDARALVDAMAALADPVEIHFRWRPQLRDPDDEMVLEAAINAKDRTIVTFNVRDFAAAADKFGVAVLTPKQLLERIR